MRIRYFHIALLNILRRKKTSIISVVIISISLLILLVTATTSESVNHYLNKYLFNTLNYRTLNIGTFKEQVGCKEAIENIASNNDEITDFYHENWGAFVKMKNLDEFNISDKIKNEKYFGNLSLNSYTKAYKEYMLSGECINNNDTQVGIIPKYFLPNGGFEIGYWREKTGFIDGETLIGKNITIEYYARDYSTDQMDIIKTFEYSFKVIGVYDILPNQNYPYDVFIPYQDMQSILENINNDNKGLSENFNITYNVVVDEERHIDDVIQELRTAGFLGMPKSQIGPFADISRYIIYSGYILGIIILFVGLINISLTMTKSIKKRTGEIGLMKAIGYQNTHLIIIVGIEAMIIGVLSLAITFIIYFLVLIIISQLITSNFSMYMQQLTFEINYSQMLKNIIAGLAIPLISSIIGMMTILSISPKEALVKGENN